jgi:tellurite methyltransferase
MEQPHGRGSAGVRALLGDMDIYLIDQLQKGRLDHGRSVLDLGCGGGRNLAYFLRQGWEVWGLDAQPEAVAVVQELAPAGADSRFMAGRIEDRPWGARRFDLVVCNAVLHFARDTAHFAEMLEAAWSAVGVGGMLFARLASDIGMQGLLQPRGDGRYLLPDGSERFLVSESTLVGWQERVGARPLESIKTTHVQGLRSMTTWVLGREAGV